MCQAWVLHLRVQTGAWRSLTCTIPCRYSDLTTKSRICQQDVPMHADMTASAAGNWQTTPKALPNTVSVCSEKASGSADQPACAAMPAMTSCAWTPVICVTLQSPLNSEWHSPEVALQLDGVSSWKESS